MFGIFRKQAATQASPPPLPRISPERAAALNRQLEEFATGDIDPLEGALTMFQINGEGYVPQVLDALGKASVELLLGENDPCSPPFMLRSSGGYPMLAVFTQRRRTAKCQQQYPENRFYLELPFPLALKSLRDGTGLVINPFEEVVTWELPPDLVKVVKEIILKEGTPSAQPPPLPS